MGEGGVGAKETTGRELNIFMHENGAAIDTYIHTHTHTLIAHHHQNMEICNQMMYERMCGNCHMAYAILLLLTAASAYHFI